jgi:hypothetical protein
LSYNFDENLDESIQHPSEFASATMTNPVLSETTVVSITPAVKNTTMTINNEASTRMSLEQRVLVKTDNVWRYVQSGTIADGDTILMFNPEDETVSEVVVTSVEYVDETRDVFSFNAEQTDLFVAGNIVVHNGKTYF